MRIFTLPPTVGSSPEPNFYDGLQKVRLRQQLEMYSLGKYRCAKQQTGSGLQTGRTTIFPILSLDTVNSGLLRTAELTIGLWYIP